MKKDIGQFREQIGVYSITRTSDGAGGFTATETLQKTMWAKVEALNPQQMVTLGQNSNYQGYKMTVRKELDYAITRQNTLAYEGKKLTIFGVFEPVISKFYLILLAYEKN
jgi:SPP1 family predicted phage head-tail adaptor